jgi:chemotaxis protein MotB
VAKKKIKEEVASEPASPIWVLSMADMFSQLMCFFILLFSVSDTKEKKLYDVMQSFRTYFKVDAPMAGYTVKSMEDTMQALSDKAFNPPDQQGFMGHSDVAVEERFGKFVSVESKEESLRLTIAAETLFEQGSADLAADASDKLALVAEKLTGYWTRLKVLGHTSPLPLPPTTTFPDHFALGYARAKTVADCLVGHWQKMGHPEEAARVEVASRGRNDPPKDWTDEAKYDRVEIIVTAEPVLRRNTLKRLGIMEEPGSPGEGKKP